MARINFTATRIEAYRCEDGKDQSLLWDEGCRWLALRATRNGSKSYVFQAKLHGKDIRITIGSPAAWTIPQARARANELKVKVDQGIDPRAEAAEAKAQADAESASKAARKLTAREVWDAYIATQRRKWSDVHYKAHVETAQEGGKPIQHRTELTRPGPLAPLLSIPLVDITADVVAKWLEKESAEHATYAGNAFRKFSAFVNWCAKHADYKSVVVSDCCRSDSVKEVVPPSRSRGNDTLQREHLSAWFAEVQKESATMSAYLRALLLTGARRREMTSLKWSDVNFQWGGSIRLYDTENDIGERIIPLTPYLSSVLNSLPRDGEYVFPPARKGGKSERLEGVNRPHTRALRRAGLPHVTLHGLRRSFATLSEWIDLPSGVVAQIMGHSPSATAEKHYKQRSLDLLRHHHIKIEQWMLEQARIAFTYEHSAN